MWSNQVAFTAGNPRVEHITGVVHLYRDVPADSPAQPSGSDAALTAQACCRYSRHFLLLSILRFALVLASAVWSLCAEPSSS